MNASQNDTDIHVIDLRSDTVTRPTRAMRQAMMDAAVGDDVYGDDPSVNQLEAFAAELTGKEAALFVASGTQSNLIALLCHCQRGDEYIAGQDAHTYRYEGGGGAVLGGVQPQPLPFNERGELTVEAIGAAIKPDDMHFARTRLLCLENTQGGKVLAMDYLLDVTDFARARGLACHLDGARAFNAAVKLSIDIKEICSLFDTVSICLSKGLGAPIGSLLLGPASMMEGARRWRKMLGGGMRQAGILAAAGQHALTHHVDRLADDHDHANQLAEGLLQLPGFNLAAMPETNMVMLDIAPGVLKPLKQHLADEGIVISGNRWVTHLDISEEDVATVLTACQSFARSL